MVIAPALVAQCHRAPRRPRGIYTVVNTQAPIINQQQATPPIIPAQLEAHFVSLYQSRLADPAIRIIAE
jgi:hypothetical protein